MGDGFWRAYSAALLHYAWLIIIVGGGGVITYVSPFLPESLSKFSPKVGLAITIAGIVIAQALAARKLVLGQGSPDAISSPGPLQLNNPTVGQLSGTVNIYAGPVTQNFNVSSPTFGAEVEAPGLNEPANDEPVDHGGAADRDQAADDDEPA